MAADCQKTKILLHCAYDMWIEHRKAYGSKLDNAAMESQSLNEKFAFHLLELHTLCNSCFGPPGESVSSGPRLCPAAPAPSAEVDSDMRVPAMNMDRELDLESPGSILEPSISSKCRSSINPHSASASVRQRFEASVHRETSPAMKSKTPSPGGASPGKRIRLDQPSESDELYQVLNIKEEEHEDWAEDAGTNEQPTDLESPTSDQYLDGNSSLASNSLDVKLPPESPEQSRLEDDPSQSAQGIGEAIEKGDTEPVHESELVPSCSEERVQEGDELDFSEIQKKFKQEPTFAEDEEESEDLDDDHSEDEFQRANHGDAQLERSTCNEQLPGSSDLRRHMNIHEQERPHECPYCDQRYAEMQDLTEHIRKHVCCSNCSKVFPSIAHLNEHSCVRDEQTGEMVYRCTRCQEEFSTQSALQEHMQSHTDQGSVFKCSHCDRTFAKRRVLNQHLMTHTGEKPHKCSVCGKAFIKRSNLERHLRSHRGEKPYECSVCGKRFTEKRTSIQHMRIHSGEKPHCCPVCDRRFAEKRYLTSHMRQHSGEMPYVCPICTRAFAYRSGRHQHMKSHL